MAWVKNIINNRKAKKQVKARLYEWVGPFYCLRF